MKRNPANTSNAVQGSVPTGGLKKRWRLYSRKIEISKSSCLPLKGIAIVSEHSRGPCTKQKDITAPKSTASCSQEARISATCAGELLNASSHSMLEANVLDLRLSPFSNGSLDFADTPNAEYSAIWNHQPLAHVGWHAT